MNLYPMRLPARQGTRQRHKSGGSPSAFTLIELMVVIAIMAILASLGFGVIKGVKKSKARSLAQAQLAEIQTALEAYKQRFGFYPPSNPDFTGTNSLVYELTGAQAVDGGRFRMTHNDQTLTTSDLRNAFGVEGIQNGLDPENRKNFYPGLSPRFISSVDVPGSSQKITVLTLPLEGPNGPNKPNPWHYNSKTPTRNAPGSYDLWIEIVLDKKLYKLGNFETGNSKEKL